MDVCTHHLVLRCLFKGQILSLLSLKLWLISGSMSATLSHSVLGNTSLRNGSKIPTRFRKGPWQEVIGLARSWGLPLPLSYSSWAWILRVARPLSEGPEGNGRSPPERTGPHSPALLVLFLPTSSLALVPGLVCWEGSDWAEVSGKILGACTCR